MADMINTRNKAYLRQLARGGDMVASTLLRSIQSASNTGVEKIVSIDNVAAKAADDVVASLRGDAADAAATLVAGRVAKLAACPRNVRCVFGGKWDGGDITVTGTDQFGAAQTEVIADAAGSTVVGTKIFKTVTAVAKEAVGVDADPTNTVTVGTGDKLAIPSVVIANGFVQLLVNDTPDVVAVDLAKNAFTPTTVPNGTNDYDLLVRIETEAL
jgi:hypothetical protein